MICYKNCLSILHTHAVCHLIFVFASEKAEPTKKQRTRHRASYVFDAVFLQFVWVFMYRQHCAVCGLSTNDCTHIADHSCTSHVHAQTIWNNSKKWFQKTSTATATFVCICTYQGVRSGVCWLSPSMPRCHRVPGGCAAGVIEGATTQFLRGQNGQSE